MVNEANVLCKQVLLHCVLDRRILQRFVDVILVFCVLQLIENQSRELGLDRAQDASDFTFRDLCFESQRTTAHLVVIVLGLRLLLGNLVLSDVLVEDLIVELEGVLVRHIVVEFASLGLDDVALVRT